MLKYTFTLGKDKLNSESKPLDKEMLYSILEHDPFNTENPNLQFKLHKIGITNLLNSSEIQNKYGGHVKKLTNFLNSSNDKAIIPKLLTEKGNPKEAGIIRFDRGEVQEDLNNNGRLAIQFLWGDLRIEIMDKENGKIGEWIAYAWDPSRNEVYIFGRDFMPTELMMDMTSTPIKRGRPSDHLITGANCGPSSIAAYLGIQTSEVINFLPTYQKMGWVNPEKNDNGKYPGLIEAWDKQGKKYNHIKYNRNNGESLSDIVRKIDHGLAFIQYFYGKNEKMSHTHWVAFDNHHEIGPVVYDVNVWRNFAFGKGNWVPLKEWENGVEGFVRENFRRQAKYKQFDGYFVKNVISLKEFEN